MTATLTSSFQTFKAIAPSNIAFVKYWGKRDPALQWAANDSISMTLSNCITTTTARRIAGPYDSFRMLAASGDPIGNTESSATPVVHTKVFKHIQLIKNILKINHALEIESRNSFPTGCGIASSASGFAALTLAVTAALLNEHRWQELEALGMSREMLADIARKGSGSAGRSLFGGYVQWFAGEQPSSQNISQIHSQDQLPLADVVVVFSDQVKHTSSSTAHLAAWGSPLFKPRLAGINQRTKMVHQAIEQQNIDLLGHEIEADALEMHAVAMTGQPQVNYFTENTRDFITWVREQREQGSFPAWFTIDAGPNVHLICHQDHCDDIANKVRERWPTAQIIMDQVGNGPTIAIEAPSAHLQQFNTNKANLSHSGNIHV